MTHQHRDALVEQIVQIQPALRDFLRERPEDLLAGNWDLMSYSFQKGFEALWDLARADVSGLLQMPVLALWGQSIELAIKSTILGIAGRIDGRHRHNLQALFEQLLDIRAAEGFDDNDELAKNVMAMIALAQSVDPAADRFRYPTARDGIAYSGMSVDLDALFQAHWIITTWCEGAALQMRGDI